MKRPSISKSLCLLFTLLIFQSLQLSQAQLDSDSCLAVVKDIFSQERKELLCQTPSGILYIIPSVNDRWIDQKMLSGELVSGEVYMKIPEGTRVDRATETLLLTKPPELFFKYEEDEDQDNNNNRHQRRLSKTHGDRTVLVVRISGTNGQVSVNESDLSKAVFGGSNDFVNLKSQYEACSHGKLQFMARPDLNGLTTNIRNGVTTIRVNLPVQIGQMALVNEVTKTLEEEFGLSRFSDIADHVMYCLPRGAFNGIAYATVNGRLSVFNDEICTSVSTQMHEIGHNLGLGHSGMGSDEYGDRTGMMGASFRSSEAPKMCFNSANLYRMGWFSDKSRSYTPGQTRWKDETTFLLASIVDYPSTPHFVLLELVQPNLQRNFYVGFNVAKGFNSGVRDAPNQVVVYEKPWADAVDTTRLADLSQGYMFRINNFNGETGATLEISVLSINLSTSVAQVKISLQRTGTPPTKPPTKPPTRSPTPRPTPRPTRGATPSPTRGGTVVGRNPTIDNNNTPSSNNGNCQTSMEECESSSDCCSGLTCRRVSQDGEFANVCRSVAKTSKDKLPRTQLYWYNRRLRGDAIAETPQELEEDGVDPSA